MAYKMDDTNWKFTAPQEGEIDSAESVADMLKEVDNAVLSPGEKAQLTSRGNDAEEASSPSSEFYDATFVYDDYKKKYVTSLHEHPTPASVPEADHAKEADHSKEADLSEKAKALTPGAKIQGHLFDGTQDITLHPSDFPDMHKVYFGTVEPDKFQGFDRELINGDIYVMYSN